MARLTAFVFALTASAEFDWEKLELPTNDRYAFDTSKIPESIRGHLDRPVTLRGYMMVPSINSTTGIKHFGMWAEVANKPVNLSRWQTLPLHHLVFVEMIDDAATEFVINRPIEVSGTLTIDILRCHDGAVCSVYKIRAIKVFQTKTRDGYYPAAEPGC